MKTVDLSKDLIGHVVLWAKCWYTDGFPGDLTRLSEVLIEYCDLPSDYQINTFKAINLLSEAATVLGVKVEDVSETLMRKTADRTVKLTYTLGTDDDIKVGDLIYATASCICAITSRSDKIQVILPALLPGMKKRYDLDPDGDRERQRS